MLIIPSPSSNRHNSFTGMVTLNPGTTPVFTLTSGRNGLFLTPLENLYWCGMKDKTNKKKQTPGTSTNSSNTKSAIEDWKMDMAYFHERVYTV